MADFLFIIPLVDYHFYTYRVLSFTLPMAYYSSVKLPKGVVKLLYEPTQARYALTKLMIFLKANRMQQPFKDCKKKELKCVGKP